MKCPKCNSDVRDGAKFCENCGQKLETPPAPDTQPINEPPKELIQCPDCGEFNYQGTEKCTRCGKALAGEALKAEKAKSENAKRTIIVIVAIVAFVTVIFS